MDTGVKRARVDGHCGRGCEASGCQLVHRRRRWRVFPFQQIFLASSLLLIHCLDGLTETTGLLKFVSAKDLPFCDVKGTTRYLEGLESSGSSKRRRLVHEYPPHYCIPYYESTL